MVTQSKVAGGNPRIRWERTVEGQFVARGEFPARGEWTATISRTGDSWVRWEACVDVGDRYRWRYPGEYGMGMSLSSCKRWVRQVIREASAVCSCGYNEARRER